jgi:hypothetical protein
VINKLRLYFKLYNNLTLISITFKHCRSLCLIFLLDVIAIVMLFLLTFIKVFN